MQRTKIPYLTHSWNPIKMRCSPISIACAENGITHCWHLAYANRLAKNPNLPMQDRIAYEGGSPILDQKELEAPLRLKKPARIGTMFMGDLFHEKIPFEFQVKVFEAMATGDHWFFLLTKRPQRMKDFFQTCEDWDPTEWPGIWLGVTICNQSEADEKIPILLQIPAAHRWVSTEPMLGPVDLEPYLNFGKLGEQWNSIDWVVLGGETGPKARPMYPDWVRSIKDQCQTAGVPFYFKQWGEWLPSGQKPAGEFKPIGKKDALTRFHLWEDSDRNVSMKVGHKAAGRLLDGREYSEIPKEV